MKFSLLTNFIWAASVAGNICLFAVLCIKGRWKTFPVFTALAAFEILRAALLLLASAGNRTEAYFWIYWITEFFDRCLEIAVLWELARVVSLNSKHQKLSSSSAVTGNTIGLAVLVAVGFSVLSHGSGSWRQIVDMHVSVFTSLITCELYLFFSLSINKLGVHRKQHIRAISNGLALMSAVSLAINTAHQAFGWNHNPVKFDQAESAVATLILFYWTRSFWYNDGLIPRFWSSVAEPRFIKHKAAERSYASGQS